MNSRGRLSPVSGLTYVLAPRRPSAEQYRRFSARRGALLVLGGEVCAEIVILFGLARRTARKSRKYHYFTHHDVVDSRVAFAKLVREGQPLHGLACREHLPRDVVREALPLRVQVPREAALSVPARHHHLVQRRLR